MIMIGITIIPTIIDTDEVKVDNSTSPSASATKPEIIAAMGEKYRTPSTLRTSAGAGRRNQVSSRKIVAMT